MIDFSEKKVLQVKRRDGSMLELVPKHVPYKAVRELKSRMASLRKRFSIFQKQEEAETRLEELKDALEKLTDPKEIKKHKEEIEALEKIVSDPNPDAMDYFDFTMAVLAEKVENFNPADFADMSADQTGKIIAALQKLEEPDKAEKKSESEKNTSASSSESSGSA